MTLRKIYGALLMDEHLTLDAVEAMMRIIKVAYLEITEGRELL